MRGVGRRMPFRRDNVRPIVTSAPVQVPETDLAAWVDFLSDWVTKDVSDRVSAVEDRYGGHSFEQSSGPAQPLWSATGINSQPAIYCTGGDYLATVTATLANALDQSQAITVYSVFERDGSSQDSIWGLGTAASSVHFAGARYGVGGDFDYQIRGDGSGITANNGTQTSGTSACLLVTQYTGSAINSWLNNTASMSAAANAKAPVCDRVFLGVHWYTASVFGAFDGWLGDQIFYATAHGADDRATVSNYLATKYGITLS